MRTSVPSQRSLFEALMSDPLTSSLAVSLVSRFQSPGNRKGRKTSATSGLISHDSSANFDPDGYSLRTYLASELSRLTLSSKTWKNQGTPLGRSWWVLMTSAPRTVAKGCGLSEGSDWPTPTGQEYGSNGDSPGETGPRRPSLSGAVKLWPTARAEDSEQTDAASGLWASPQARDWKDSGPTQGNRKSPNLGTQAFAGLLAPASPSTPGKPQDWPTPQSSDAIGGKGPRTGMSPTGKMPDGSKATVNLRAAIVLKDAEFLDRFAKSIRDEIHATEWPTPQANRHGAPDSHGKSPIRGGLNPAWVTQLMQFPDGWLDSEPPTPPRTAAKPSKHSGTPSVPPSSK